MLLAYHKDTLSKESTSMFQNIRSSASIARRSFRLLKSLNHIANIFDTITLLCSSSGSGSNRKDSNDKDNSDLFFSMMYEACLAFLYYYDNHVFLSRYHDLTFTSCIIVIICYNYDGILFYRHVI